VIDLSELWNTISQSLPPYFLGTLASAAFGAFAGAWINSRIQAKKTAVAELNSVNSAIALCVSMCNSSLAFKRQFVAPMHEAYERVRKEYDKTIAARREGLNAPFNPRAELQTLMLPKMPTEAFERYVFEKISIRGRALAAAVQLVGSIDGLANAIKTLNELIAEFRETPPDQRLAKYLSLRSAEGVVDDRYRAAVAGIFDQTNDCIFFSRILAEDLLKYGHRLRVRYHRRFRFGLPKLDQADWSKAETAGLMPSAELYKAWLDGFKPAPSSWRRLIAWLRRPFRKGRTRAGSTKPSLSDTNVTKAKAEFHPSRDRVLIRRIDADQKTAGGIIIPDFARDTQQGHILAIGSGARDKRGRMIPIDLKIGDKVLFLKGAGVEINLERENLLIMNESDIMGVTLPR
jgi:chaperonin GroES